MKRRNFIVGCMAVGAMALRPFRAMEENLWGT